MTWGRWVSQCQWDAACRAFLQRDPAFGMATARLANGGTEGYASGWNRWVPSSKSRPTLYVFIGDQHGLTTLAPPPPGAPVQDIERQPADLHRSPLWQALITSGDHLIGHGGGPPERVYRVRHDVQQSATVDRFLDELDEMAPEAVEVESPLLARMRSASRHAMVDLADRFGAIAKNLDNAGLTNLADELASVAKLLDGEPIVTRYLTVAAEDGGIACWPPVEKQAIDRIP